MQAITFVQRDESRSRIYRWLLWTMVLNQGLLLAYRHLRPVWAMSTHARDGIFIGALVATAGMACWAAWLAVTQHRRIVRDGSGG